MITAFEVLAKLGFDDSSFKQGVDNAEKSGRSLGNSLASSFDKIKRAAAVAISVAGIKKGIDAIRELARATAAAGDKIDKQSQALGMSRRAYQEWDYILSQNGSSIDSMSAAMKTLNSTILSGIDGSESAAESIRELGMYVEDLDGLSQEAQFEQVVRAFQHMPAGANKSALAVKLFGRAGMQLLPLLNSSSTSIDELKAKAEELGLIMSDDAVDASVEYSDALDTMQRTFDGIKRSIGAKVLPIMTNFMQKIAGWAGRLMTAFNKNGLKGVWDELTADIQKLKYSDNPFLSGLGKAIDWVMGLAKDCIELVTDFPGKIAEMRESDNPFIEGLATVLEGLKASVEWVITLFNDFPEAVRQLKESDNVVFQLLADVIVTIKDGITSLVQLINGDYEDALHTLNNSDSELLQFIGTSVDAFADAKKTVNEYIDATREALGLAGSAGKLYGTWTDKMVKGFSEISDDAGFKKWLADFESGLSEAEVSAEHIQKLTKLAQATVDKYGYGSHEANTKFRMMMANYTSPYSGYGDIGRYLDMEMASLKEKVEDEPIEPPVTPVVDGKTLEEAEAELHAELGRPIIAPVLPTVIRNREREESRYLPPDATWEGIDTEGVWDSNAKGLWDVPYDDYYTKLHRHETVLSASQARDYKEGNSGGNTREIVNELRALREDMQNLKLVVGRKVFGRAVVSYGGGRMNDYIGAADSKAAAGFGT